MDEISTKIVGVIPISRVNFIDTLSYFTLKNVSVGELVHINLNGKETPAIVFEISNLESSKQSVRTRSFSTKKLTDVSNRVLLSKAQLSAVLTLSTYFAKGPSQILHALLANSTLKSDFIYSAPESLRTNKHDLEFAQLSDEHALDLCRENLSDQNKTIILCSNKNKVNKVSKELDSKNAIVCTPQSLLVNIENANTIIILGENDLRDNSPGSDLDWVRVATKLSEIFGNKLIITDPLLSLESQFQVKKIKQAKLHFPTLKFKLEILKDAKTIISNDLKNILKDASTDLKIFIHVSRKNYANTTYCKDCGSTQDCSRCSSPLSYTKDKQRQFVCTRCNQKHPGDITCTKCGGWNLVPYGFGIERVREEIETMIGKKKLEQGHIEISTKLPSTQYNHVVVLNMDGLLMLPNFNVEMEIVNKLLKMQQLSDKSLFVQSRHEDGFIARLAETELEKIVDQQLKQRETLDYPPYSTYIKIITRGNKVGIKKAVGNLENVLHDYKTRTYKAYVPIIKGQHYMNTLIKLAPNAWPDKNLAKILRSLGPQHKVNVFARDLL